MDAPLPGPSRARSTPRTRAWCALFVALLATVLALPSAPALAHGQDREQDPVLEFRKYFKKQKDVATRVEAVLTLEGVESYAVVDELVPLLEDPEPLLANAVLRVLSRLEQPVSVGRLVGMLGEARSEARRLGILQALEGKHFAEIRPAVEPLLADPSWPVRRQALIVLARHQDAGVAPLLVPLCKDPEPAVACAALEALGALHSELVVQPAIDALLDPSWQVRASAIEALRGARHKDGIGALIERLAVEEGRLSVDLVAALESLTGLFDKGSDVAKWRAFWETAKENYSVPTEGQVAFLREKRLEFARPRTGVEEAGTGANAPAEKVVYHSIETPSRAVIFVIDVSGSMEQEVSEKERFADGGYPSFHRMDIMKTELIRTLEKLESYVKFNIIAFATDVDFWKKDLVPANELNKAAAVSWIGRLEAIGGSSKEDLARVGLVGMANLEAGKTNTYGALTAALGMVAGRPSSKDRYQLEADTIFFLSDGRPSHGLYVDTDDILREINAANALRKVVIHVIAIGEFEKDFMQVLAAQNGGEFVDLGR